MNVNEAQPNSVPLISLPQPYAWMVCHGLRTTVVHTQPIDYRGVVFIHANKDQLEENYELINQRHPLLLPRQDHLLVDYVIGSAVIIDSEKSSLNPHLHVLHLTAWKELQLAIHLPNLTQRFSVLEGTQALALLNDRQAETTYPDIAARIVSCREELGFKQKEFATLCSLDRNLFARCEANFQGQDCLDYLREIATALKVSLNWLRYGTGEKRLDTFLPEIAQRITERREALKFSTTALAIRTGFREVTVRRLCRCFWSSDTQYLPLLAKALYVTVGWLENGTSQTNEHAVAATANAEENQPSAPHAVSPYKARRLELGLKLSDIAKYIGGISSLTVSEWEDNPQQASAAHRSRWMAALQMDPDS